MFLKENMAVGTVLFSMFLSYYTIYFLYFFNKSNRDKIQNMNVKLRVLRKIPIKSIEEQKEFINLRYPKTPSFKFHWSIIPYFIWRIFLYILCFKIWFEIFKFFYIDFYLWQSILIMVIFPIIVNFILRKFNLETGDISVFFK